MSKFIITSTVATDFGTGDRLNETLHTIASIRKRLDAEIILVDSSVHDWDENPVREAVDTFMRVNGSHVLNIIESGYGMPFVKSATEVYLTQIALDIIGATNDTIYKISGRYRLTDEFSPADCKKFVFLKPQSTSISYDKCESKGMFMTRLYSLPGEFRSFYMNVLTQVSKYLWRTYARHGLTDIEHGLYKHIPHDLCKFVEVIGVEGRIGHTRLTVRE